MPDQTSTATSAAVTGILADLPVTAKATTSRVVVNNPLLRVVYFSFDAGQELTAHTSPRAVVVTCLTGVIDFTVGSDVHRMTAGDVIYLAPNERHALVAVEAAQMSLVMVETEPAGTSTR